MNDKRYILHKRRYDPVYDLRDCFNDRRYDFRKRRDIMGMVTLAIEKLTEMLPKFLEFAIQMIANIATVMISGSAATRETSRSIPA